MVLRNSLGHFKHIPCFMFSFKIIEYCFHAFIIISSHGVQINYFLLFHQNGATRPMNAQMNGYNDSKYFYKVRIEKIFKDPSDHGRNGSAGKMGLKI